MHEPIIALQNVQLRLPSAAGEVNILRGVDLEIESGECVAITGPSGSGKSSLMMVATGLDRPSAGTVRVAGQELGRLDEDGLARFRRRTIGLVFQSFHLVPTMDALENVAVPLELAGHRDAFVPAREALEAVGLGHRLSHYPAQLSGGEQQRVALARAIAIEPKLIFADEPTGNLDTATSTQIADLLFALRRRLGTTLVLITHEPALAARCDRVVAMQDGRVTAAQETARPRQAAP